MPLYHVRFLRSAEKDLRKLSAAMRRRALEAADNLAIDPRPPGCRKLEGGEDAYRIRFGDYRIVYTIDDGVKIVSITYVRHRREVYR